MRRQPSTRPSARLAAQLRAERRAARDAAAARRRMLPHVYNRFTRRFIRDTRQNRRRIAARVIQDWFLGGEFDTTVLIYRPPKPTDGPGRQRNERGDVLMIQPQTARIPMRDLVALRRGDWEVFKSTFEELSLFMSETGPSSYEIVSARKVSTTGQPLALSTSLAMGDGRVDDPYIKFAPGATSEFSNPWVRKNKINGACWFSHIIDVYRGPFNAYLDKYRTSTAFPRNLDYESMWAICFPQRPFDRLALQAGMNFHDVAPFFKAFGLGLREVNALRETLNVITATRTGGGRIPAGMVVMKTDKHVHRFNVTDKDKDANGKSLKRQLEQRAAHGTLAPVSRKPTPLTRLPKPTYEPPKERVVVIWGAEDGPSLDELLLAGEYAGKAVLAVCADVGVAAA